MDEKLSEQAAKVVDQTFENLHELDVHEQNKALVVLCTKILEQRKLQLDRMTDELNAYGQKKDELIKMLQGFV